MTRTTVISPVLPVYLMPAESSAARVLRAPAVPKSRTWLFAVLTRSNPPSLRCLA